MKLLLCLPALLLLVSSVLAAPELSVDRTVRTVEETIAASGDSFGIKVAGHTDPVMRRLEIVGPVTNPKVVADRWIDPETPQTVLSYILKPGMTEREKAYAIFWYCLENFSSNVPYIWDEARFACALGFGHCGPRNYAQRVLANAAGLRWRGLNLPSHNCFEFWFDGRWNILDVHMRAIFPDATGLVAASAAELAADPRLISRNYDADLSEMSTVEYPPERAQKYQDYLLGVYGVFKEAAPEELGKRLPWDDNKIAYRLREGERIIFWWYRPERLIKWRGDPPIQTIVEPSDWTNPQLIYEPDLTSPAAAEGVVSAENIAWGGGEVPLHPQRAGEPASVTWEISSYYNLMASTIEGEFAGGGEEDVVRLSLSVDGGKTWTPAWQHVGAGTVEATIPVSEVVSFEQDCYAKGLRSYLARLEMTAAQDPAQVGVARLKFTTELLTYNRALPALRLGDNRITVTAADLPHPLRVIYEYDEVHSLQADRYDPVENQPVTITASVTNHGDETARDIPVQFYDGDPAGLGKPIGQPVFIPTLAPGQSADATLTWACVATGDRGPWVTINSTLSPKPEKPYHYDFSRIYAVVNPGEDKPTREQTARLPYLPLFIREQPRLLIGEDHLQFLEEPNQPGKVRIRATVRNACHGQRWIYVRGTTVQDVVVRFYDGDPAQPGAQQIGADQVIPELGPVGFASVDVVWDTAGAAPGAHDIWVLVDPEGKIKEKDTRFPDRAVKTYEVAR